jgi:hypothetical protein
MVFERCKVEISNLLATILEISHKRLLDSIKLGELHINRFPCPLEILSAFGQIFATLNAGRSDSKGTLH